MSFSFNTVDQSIVSDADTERGHKIVAWAFRLISWGCGVAAAWGCSTIFGGICLFALTSIAVSLVLLAIHFYMALKLDDAVFASIGAKVGHFTGWCASFIPKSKATA